MVILQFNKLIRNKWVWGVFALVVSAVFVCPDNLFSNRSDAKTTTSFGKLAGKEVDANIFNAQVAIARANERNMAARGARIPESSYLERNHNAWPRAIRSRMSHCVRLRYRGCRQRSPSRSWRQ